MKTLKFFIIFLLINLAWQSNAQTPWSNGNLKVSSNHRMLQYQNGKPFFWLGDTAWSLSFKLSQNDINTYLNDRANKKFNIIQMSIQPTKKNTNNQEPFLNNKYDTPNEKYWKNIDYIIKKAAEKGMYIALLPSWGENITNESDAQVYGTWIGNRYKNTPNIIWIIGGDDDPSNNMAIWDALATAIKTVDQNHLMTFHPNGYSSSSKWFHNRSWLDFNMYQSGHGTASVTNSIADLATADYNKTPTKPTIDGEPRYETIQRNFYLDPPGTRFVPYEIREATYRHLFAGTFGVTYGHHSVWQFYKGGNDSFCCGKPIKTWQEGLNDPAGTQMQFLSNLMRSRPILGRIPDQSLLTGTSSGSSSIQATKGIGYAFLYLSSGEDVTVNMNVISGTSIKAWWYNPRNGEATEIGTQSKGTFTFNPPGNVGQGNDWILVLDDADKGYGTPGVEGSTLSIVEQDFFNVQLSPNPVVNVLKISAKDIIETISVFNVSGQEVEKFKPNATKINISTSSFSAGIYFVKIQINEEIRSFKVIKE